MDKQILDEQNQIFLESYEQKYQGLFLHPEAGGDPHINEAFDDIKSDMQKLNDTLVKTGNAVNDLLINTVNRLEIVKQNILLEKERLQDVQMLCNRYMDFDSVKSLDDLNFTGSFTYKDNVYYASPKKDKQVSLKILDVYGNGYEGNEFVFNNYQYQKEVYDTSVREHMIDRKISTYYEYSRIIVQDTKEVTNNYFNKDSDYAHCTITFEANDYINYVNIATEDLGVYITDIQTSIDGIKYTAMEMPCKMAINKKEESYKNYGYVFGSGAISIPLCKFFKITFETDTYKSDMLAYDKTIVLEREHDLNYQDVVIPDWMIGSGIEFTMENNIVPSAKRSVIKINDITASKNIYNTKNMMKTGELIEGEAYSISLFANVFVPESLDSDSVEFYFTINGIDYEVVPINSHSNGTKVLRFSGGKSSTLYTELLSEKITSAYLTILIKSSSDATPMLNNIKVLLGGEL
jgi:hypothetical protein